MVLKRNNKKTTRKIKHKGSKKNKKNMRKSNRNKSSKKNVKKIKRTRKQMGGKNIGSHKEHAQYFLDNTEPRSIILKASPPEDFSKGDPINVPIQYLLKNLIKKEMPWTDKYDKTDKYRKHAYIKNYLDNHTNLEDGDYLNLNTKQDYNKGEKLYFITSVNKVESAGNDTDKSAIAPQQKLSMYNCKKLSNYLNDLASRIKSNNHEDDVINKTIKQMEELRDSYTKDEMIETIKFAAENLDEWIEKTQQLISKKQ
jgi:hypothetical protein